MAKALSTAMARNGRQRLPAHGLLKSLAPLVIAGVLGGCSMAPHYNRPALPVAGDYAGVSTDGNPARDAAVLGWRQFFPDARLQALISEALDNNRDLRTAALNIEAARAEYRITQADWLPHINANFERNRQRLAPVQTTSGTAVVGTTYSSGFGISAYELDFFGRIASLDQAALQSYLQTEESRRAAQISLIASVAQTYLGEVALREQVALAQQTLNSRLDDQRLTKMRLDVGASSALDYQLGNTLVESARISLSSLKRQQGQAVDALTLLVGKPLGDLPGGDSLENQGIIADIPAGVPSDLLTRRPDIAAAEDALKAANANIGAARAAFFPSISLTATYGGASSSLNSLFNSTNRSWSFVPQINLPIFNGGANVANLTLSEVRKNLAVVTYEKTIQTAFSEVSDALVAREALDDQLKSQLAYLNAQQERAKLTELRYKNGVASSTDREQAQRDLFDAQQSLITTRQQRLSNAVDLYRSLGGGLNENTAVAAEGTANAAETSGAVKQDSQNAR